jgi:hypothetical protein
MKSSKRDHRQSEPTSSRPRGGGDCGGDDDKVCHDSESAGVEVPDEASGVVATEEEHDWPLEDNMMSPALGLSTTTEDGG